jgi:hypothetical protein
MAVPAYLAASFHFKETALITDVNDLITAITDELVNQNSPAWTNQGGGLFKSPVDASGRWIDLLFTRIAANNLDMRARDNLGQTICQGRMQVAAAGRVCRIFSGQYHFHVETVALGTYGEYLRAGILDLSPESQTQHTQWAYAHTIRTTADALRSNYKNENLFMWDNNAYADGTRATGFMLLSGAATWLSLSGGYIFMAYPVTAKPPGETTYFCYAGRLYNQMMGDPSKIVPGAEFTIPIDAGTFGTFKVSSMNGGTYSQLLLRIA